MNDSKTKHYLVTIAEVATGGDDALACAIDERGIPFERNLYQLFRRFGIVKSDELVHDVRRAYVGQQPVYFARAGTLVARFRARHNLGEPEQHRGSSHSTAEAVREVVEAMRSDSATDPYKRDGLACPRQRRAFYKSDAWSNRSATTRAIDGFTCQSCGVSDVELHAHHSAPIQSVFSRTFYKNFETNRLRTWCRSCHQEYHNNAVADVNGFHFAGHGELQKERKHNRDRREKHDEARECDWCKKFAWN